MGGFDNSVSAHAFRLEDVKAVFILIAELGPRSSEG